jgi:hypothetical protein
MLSWKRASGRERRPLERARRTVKATPGERAGMQAKPEYRDRDDTEVAVLDALVDRTEEGMTVFELRAGVESDIDIDDLEEALADLKADGLITVENDEDPMRIYPDERVVPAHEAGEDDPTLFDRLRERLGI